MDKLVGTPWTIHDGQVVPGTDDVKLYSNDAVKLDAEMRIYRSSYRWSV